MTTALDRLTKAGVPDRYVERTFANWRVRPGTEAAYAAAVEWAGLPLDSDRGLVLFGPPGTGKSHLAVAALRTRLERAETTPAIEPHDIVGRARHLHADYVVVPLMLDRLRSAIRHPGNPTEDWFAHLRDTCSLLVLDDLGREKLTDWADERLYVLIESRYGRRLPTVATSNLDPAQMSAAGYSALVSRLTETCDFAAVRATDYRPTVGGHS